ncbi:collagen-like protein, partial [Blautia hydrogenotrophica]
GATGATGATGPVGPGPVVTVSESTPVSYKLTFTSDQQAVTTPNLYSNFTNYSLDMSTTGSVFNMPVGNLILNYQKTGTNTMRISVRSKDTATPITADISRSSIYGGGSTEAQYLDNVQISTLTTIDDTVYMDSQELHWIRVRQQDPTSSLWSLCVVRMFGSRNGARISIWVQWIQYNVSFSAPTT